jgi:small nuclear ribonucleoprotein (snRNP)-like protein
MCRRVTMLLTLLMFAPALAAREKSAWDNVEKLKPWTTIQVDMWNGETFTGRIYSVDDSTLTVVLRNFTARRPGVERSVGRELIRKIERVRQVSLPDPTNCAIAGALITGAGLAIEGGITDGGAAALVEGAFGAFVGPGVGEIACGVVAIIELASVLVHPRSLVYRADHQVMRQVPVSIP